MPIHYIRRYLYLLSSNTTLLFRRTGQTDPFSTVCAAKEVVVRRDFSGQYGTCVHYSDSAFESSIGHHIVVPRCQTEPHA